MVKISQTASIKQFYEIEGDDGFYFEGKSGSISRLQSISIFNQNTTIKGIYKIPKWVNFIPFGYLFGKANVTRVFNLYRNDELYGSICLWTHGFLKSCYVIQLNDAVLHCYPRLTVAGLLTARTRCTMFRPFLQTSVNPLKNVCLVK